MTYLPSVIIRILYIKTNYVDNHLLSFFFKQGIYKSYTIFL